MTRPYRGVSGGRGRERDEPGASEYPARFAGRCAQTGAVIQPGDIIQKDANGRVILVKSNAPRR
jgi:hypothetical protein